MFLLDWIRRQGNDIVVNIVAALIWAVACVLAGVVIGLLASSRRRFEGRWDVQIAWDPAWVPKLTGFRPQQCLSEGSLWLCYDATRGKGEYSGLSLFALELNNEKYAELCVEFEHVALCRSLIRRRHELVSSRLRAHFRQATPAARDNADFKYAPFYDYEIVYGQPQPDADRIEGDIYVTLSGNRNSVGSVRMVRKV